LRVFFDTSVLIAAFLEDHEHHGASLEALVKIRKGHGYCGAHSLAEVYSTLTRLPGRHRLSGEQALLLLGNIRERLAIVTLDDQEYYAAIEECAAVGTVGGAVYDALLTRCALKARADMLYTWNLKHFQQLGPEVAKRTRTP
jgi:predicted nucleic acid-binding protein